MSAVKLQTLHPGQKYIGRNGRRFNAVRCGRRFGKTQFGLHRLILPPGLIVGQPIPPFPVAWFAPTYKYLSEVWRDANRILAPAIESRDKTERVIRLRNGGQIDFWTLDDPDAGRGRKYRHVVIDEAAKVRKLEEAWTQSIRPTLTDFAGTADFLSTPKGRDYFAQLCERALTDPANWGSFHMPTSANPFIDPAEIEAARLELPDLVFRQEYLAEFVDFQGTVVKREWLRYGDPLIKWKEEQLVTCMGVDLASSLKDTADYFAAVVLSRDPDGYYWVRHAERARLPFRDQIRLAAHLAELHKVRQVYVEEVAYQSAAVQELLAMTTFAIFGIKPDKDKFRRFLAMQSRFQRGYIVFEEHLPPAFEGEILSFTGDDDVDEHDDFVDALVYAYHACNAAWLDQPKDGTGARVAVQGARIDSTVGWGTVKVTPRR